MNRINLSSSLLGSLLVFGCSPAPEVSYFSKSLNSSITLKDDNIAHVSYAGTVAEGSYEKDGNQIRIKGPNQQIMILTITGNELSGFPLTTLYLPELIEGEFSSMSGETRKFDNQGNVHIDGEISAVMRYKKVADRLYVYSEQTSLSNAEDYFVQTKNMLQDMRGNAFYQPQYIEGKYRAQYTASHSTEGIKFDLNGNVTSVGKNDYVMGTATYKVLGSNLLVTSVNGNTKKYLRYRVKGNQLIDKGRIVYTLVK